MKYTRRCYKCGSPTEAETPKGKVYCEICSQPDKKPQKFHHDEAEYRVIYDPLPECEGGFSPGAYISCVELRRMRQADIRAFNPGTVIVDSNGRKYIIQDRLGSNSQAVIAIEGCDGRRN